MKKGKLFFIIFFSILLFFTFLNNNALAVSCDWSEESWEPYENNSWAITPACSPVSPDSKCPGKKPDELIDSDGVISKFVCCCEKVVETTATKTPDLNPLGNLQVKIPGLDEIAKKYPASCETSAGGQTNCEIPWIAIYIKAIYNYMLIIGGIVAVIALMIGGIIWLVSAGNASRISEAKSWITGSITGVTILLTSYILLYQINPELVNLKPLKLRSIDPVAGDTTVPSVNGSAGGPFTSGATADYIKTIGIYCPQSGGSKEIKKIAESFKGKLVYRLGSKNGKGDEYDVNKPQEKYGLSCPNNKNWGEKVVCYDCSGFVRQVLWCAGFTKDPGSGTSIIFPGTEKINKCETTNNKPAINGKELVEGDLIGWYPKGDGSNSGHVLIYIGEGKLADSHGKRSYPPAEAYGVFNLCTEVNKRKSELIKSGRDLYIKRIGSY